MVPKVFMILHQRSSIRYPFGDPSRCHLHPDFLAPTDSASQVQFSDNKLSNAGTNPRNEYYNRCLLSNFFFFCQLIANFPTSLLQKIVNGLLKGEKCGEVST